MNKIHLAKESETLVIPLVSRAKLSRENTLLHDPMAEKITESVDYDFSQIHTPRLLDLYMSVRSAIIDDYANSFLSSHPDSVVVQLGCGLDGRCVRVTQPYHCWYDLDFPNVIEARSLFYNESERYKMIASSVCDLSWLDKVDTNGHPILVIAEGLVMYLSESELHALFNSFCQRFVAADILFDAYSHYSAKKSARKNPVNQFGAVIRSGIDSPQEILTINPRLHWRETKSFADSPRIDKLKLSDRLWFRLIRFKPIDNLYRIYSFSIS